MLDRANTIFGRIEWIRKSAADLVLDGPPLSLPPDRELGIGSVTVGYIRELVVFKGAALGLGGMGTVNAVPAVLGAAYGSRTPVGGMIFLRIRPVLAGRGAGMPGMEMRD